MDTLTIYGRADSGDRKGRRRSVRETGLQDLRARSAKGLMAYIEDVSEGRGLTFDLGRMTC